MHSCLKPEDDDRKELAKLISQARSGCSQALGQLLEKYRGYLLWLANRELDHNIQAKGGASDLVQVTALRAHQAFAQFQGNSDEEMLAWLRRILLNNLSNFRRHYQATDKRDVTRERTIDGESHESPRRDQLFSELPTPSSLMSGDEQRSRLLSIVHRLPEDYRRVIYLRYWEHYSFERIGAEMKRSADAARKLWGRALTRLQQEWEESPRDFP